ncbi:MAG: excinuclease ABC subunit UvrA [Thermoflexales bacterium]|nr:excinuclease ABC subunit UvrA [Thermoflexales bacterium]
MKHITISGARLHNLKNVDVGIPKDSLVVVTGVSGSGKSSLAFDIVFEEERKQYLQSIGMLWNIAGEDAFDQIDGIGPTVAVQQAIIRQSNPRSVVGTRTRLLAYLGMLYAREGHMPCSLCGTSVGGDLACEQCGNVEERLAANVFSFNSPNGMCLACEGRGVHFELAMDRLVPDEAITLSQVLARAGALSTFQHLLKGRLKPYADTPFRQMPDEARDHILYGLEIRNPYRKRSHNLFDHLKHRAARGEGAGDVIEVTDCPECQGYRVGPEARRVTLGRKHIGQLGRMTIAELGTFLQDLAAQEPLSPFGQNLVKDILRITADLSHVGLGHLSSYRAIPTLSGGELQRLFLASHLESKMNSLIYVLDEPTVGLHELEKADLLDQIEALKELGNTVIVVEHDRNTIERAQHVIDFGPLAGVEGGQVVYQGDYAGLLRSERSITGQYLSGRLAVPAKARHDYAPVTSATPRLRLYHARTNNLKDVDVAFPLGVLVGVAGVSGSGKSSLVSDTLVPLLARQAMEAEEVESDAGEEADFVVPGPRAGAIDGLEHIAGFALVSQSPIGRRHDSHPASYVGIWNKIRALFARQPLARQRGYSPAHFSFSAKGACPACKGLGHHRYWLGGNQFVSSRCQECQGQRYEPGVLAVTYRGKSILDVLAMSVSEAAAFFQDTPSIHAMLDVLARTGLGYISLGQPSPTLSGGEAQRVKLAKEIGRRRRGNILYILDEPSTGLSLYDTARLLAILDTLVKQGNSAIVIEHDPGILAYCDWLIELGPGGGNEGGQIIAEGSPWTLRGDPRSRVGPFLKVGVP